MYVLDVIVISKGVKKEILTYFSIKEALPGTLVRVPVRSKIYPALVVAIRDASDMKGEIKNSPFGFKRIENITGNAPFRKESVQVAQMLGDYYLTETGAILDLFVPEAVLDEKMPQAEEIETHHTTRVKTEKLVFQATFEDRISYYKTYIRESFARKESVAIVLPTVSDITIFSEHLSKGIEDNVVLLSSNLSTKKIQTIWKRVCTDQHPKLIISTPLFLSIPKNDVGTFIIEHEASSSYVSRNKPHVDQRLYVEILSNKLGKKLIFADTLLRVNTIVRREQGEFDEVMPMSFRLPAVRDTQIVSMISEENKTPLSPFFSPSLIEEIKRTVSSKNNVFLFALRKGLATKIICQDCGTQLICENCNSGLSLFEKDEKRITYCKNCKMENQAPTHCTNCESWRLIPLGVGVDALHDAVKVLFPDTPVFKMDSNSLKSEKLAQAVSKEFEETRGSILVGTEMAFGYLNDAVSLCGVISFDTLLSLPHFDREERLLQLLSILCLITERTLLIQTRHPDNKLLQCIQHGSVIDWYRNESDIRKEGNYPPFSRLIRLSFIGPQYKEEEQARYAESILIGYSPNSYRGPNMLVKRDTPYILLQLSPQTWSLSKDSAIQDKVLLSILDRLTAFWSIEIDPKNLYN